MWCSCQMWDVRWSYRAGSGWCWFWPKSNPSFTDLFCPPQPVMGAGAGPELQRSPTRRIRASSGPLLPPHEQLDRNRATTWPHHKSITTKGVRIDLSKKWSRTNDKDRSRTTLTTSLALLSTSSSRTSAAPCLIFVGMIRSSALRSCVVIFCINNCLLCIMDDLNVLKFTLNPTETSQGSVVLPVGLMTKLRLETLFCIWVKGNKVGASYQIHISLGRFRTSRPFPPNTKNRVLGQENWFQTSTLLV